jgi:hypothetical protein
VTRLRGSKIGRNCVTSFKDDPNRATAWISTASETSAANLTVIDIPLPKAENSVSWSLLDKNIMRKLTNQFPSDPPHRAAGYTIEI